MFAIGDIVEIFAPQAGHKKYHVCILKAGDGAAWRFLYLNSDPSFDQTYAVDCARVPCIPPSKTGKTVFTFAMIPLYTDAQLKLFRANKIGELDPILATEVLKFLPSVKAMTSRERIIVTEAMTMIAKANVD